MTLQPEDGVPSFYTFATFRLGRITLLYGGLLSVAAFCVVVFLFNYGIREKLWSFPAVEYGSILPSQAQAPNTAPETRPARRTIVKVALPAWTLHSLVGSYVSTTAYSKYTITLEGDQLKVQINGQNKFDLVPVSDHSLYGNDEFTIDFEATHAGRIEQLDIYDRGRHIVASRQ